MGNNNCGGAMVSTSAWNAGDPWFESRSWYDRFFYFNIHLFILLPVSCNTSNLLKKYIYTHLDDIDFLNYIPKSDPSNTLLVSFDVVNLYTNIPHELGIEAINSWLSKYPELIHKRFSKEFI